MQSQLCVLNISLPPKKNSESSLSHFFARRGEGSANHDAFFHRLKLQWGLLTFKRIGATTLIAPPWQGRFGPNTSQHPWGSGGCSQDQAQAGLG